MKKRTRRRWQHPSIFLASFSSSSSSSSSSSETQKSWCKKQQRGFEERPGEAEREGRGKNSSIIHDVIWVRRAGVHSHFGREPEEEEEEEEDEEEDEDEVALSKFFFLTLHLHCLLCPCCHLLNS